MRERRNATPRQRQMSSWGYKFEQLMLSDSRDGDTIEDSPAPPVLEAEEYCCVFRTRLGAHSLVYGAEMDGKIVGGHTEGDFVELKTSRQVEHEVHKINRIKIHPLATMVDL